MIVAWIFGGVGVWRLVGVAAPPWIPDLRRGRRFGGMPDVGKGRKVGGVAALPVCPGGCPQEAPLQDVVGRCAGVWIWRLVGVAAPPWIPDLRRGRRVGRMPDVGKGWQVGGGSRVARPPRRVPTRGTPTRRGWSMCRGVDMAVGGVAAPPWVPDLRRGRRFGGMPDVGKGRKVGGVAALPVRPGGCPQEAPLQGGQASVGLWLCSVLVGVAAPPWVPDLRRGRRFGGMPDVGKGRKVSGVAALPVCPGGCPQEAPLQDVVGRCAGVWIWRLVG